MPLSSVELAVLFVVGVCVGSFLNVISLRFHPRARLLTRDAVTGRSKCLSCRKNLSWWELLPVVSFALQGGKCRSCKNSISFQYPLVEIISGILFVAVPLTLKEFFVFWDPSWSQYLFIAVSLLWIAVFELLLLAFIIDVRHYIIPNSVNAGIFILGIIWTALGWKMNLFANAFQGSFLKQFSSILFPFDGVLLNHGFGLFIGTFFFFLIFALSRGGAMGMGDIKLIAGLGLLFGWPDILMLILASFILGALVSVFLIAIKRKLISDKVPFGPFLVLAAAVVFFFGAGLIESYFAIIGV